MSQSLGHVVLNGARNILRDETHWVKGSEKEDDAYCIDGAIIESAGRLVADRAGRRRAAQAARRIIYAGTTFRSRRDIHRWNDDKERTHAEVVSLLDRCAA